MTRVLTAGWENRCRHPNLRTYLELNMQGQETYPAGGVEGVGSMQNGAQAISSAYEHLNASMYNLDNSDPHIYLNVDMQIPYLDPGYLLNWQSKIYWDDYDNSSPSYVSFDSVDNKIRWVWGASSGETDWIIQTGVWYNIDLHVYINAAGDSIIDLWIDGFQALYVEEAIVVPYVTINRIGLGGYNRYSVPTSFPVLMHIWDNLKVNNSIGIAPDNIWPYHLIIIGRFPNGPGSNTNLTPRPDPPADPNWQNVDDLTPDGLAWNEGLVGILLDTYAAEDAPVEIMGTPNYDITRIFIEACHRVAVPVGDGFYPVLWIAGNPFYGDLMVSGSGYHCFQSSHWLVNPVTALEWTKNDLTDLEFGAETYQTP